VRSKNDRNCGVTKEELSALACGDLENERAVAVRAHVATCSVCQRFLRAVRTVDSALGAARCLAPPANAVLAAQRVLSAEVRRREPREIMTLGEVAEYLRVTMEELEEIARDLPAFELGGKIRVRRTRLLEWIGRREKDYLRSAVQSEVAGIIAGMERIRT
jgi:excisionase family DNA binding protein